MNSLKTIAWPAVVLFLASGPASAASDHSVSRGSAVEVPVAGSSAAELEFLPTLESVLKKYVEALGGKEAVGNIR
jgi:hypothetical protein